MMALVDNLPLRYDPIIFNDPKDPVYNPRISSADRFDAV